MHLSAERDGDGFTLLGLPRELTEPESDPDSSREALISLADPYSFPAEELLELAGAHPSRTPGTGRACERSDRRGLGPVS